MSRLHRSVVAVVSAALVAAGCASEATPSGGADTTEPVIAADDVATTSSAPPTTAVTSSAPPTSEAPVTEPPVTEPPATTTSTTLPSEAVFLGPPGTESQLSTVSFADTVSNARAAIEADARFVLLAEIDHAADAAETGIDLLPTTAFVIGSAELDVPLIQADPDVGLDLPQHLVITQDASGNVGVFWNRPGHIVLRHELDVPTVVDEVESSSSALRALANQAAASSEPSNGGRPSPGPDEPPVVRTSIAGTVDDVAALLLAEVEANTDLELVAVVDLGETAAGVGVELEATQLILRNPAETAPLLQAAQTAALDLPYKLLLVQQGDDVAVTHNDPAGVAARHGIDPATPAIAAMSARFAALVAAATG